LIISGGLELQVDSQYLQTKIQKIAFGLERLHEEIHHFFLECFSMRRVNFNQMESDVSYAFKKELNGCEIINSCSFEHLPYYFDLVFEKLGVM